MLSAYTCRVVFSAVIKWRWLVCRFFRKSTVCFSWIKADLWWPFDTHLCQLDIFGKALRGCATFSFRDYDQTEARDCFLSRLFFLNCRWSVCDPTIVLSLRLSFDEGRNWDKYSFTSSPLYVDGVLGEPGEDTLIMTWDMKELQRAHVFLVC